MFLGAVGAGCAGVGICGLVISVFARISAGVSMPGIFGKPLAAWSMFRWNRANFTRGKKAVADFRGTWAKITKAAGCPGLLFHDLRRSAVRNMVRAGIPETVCMKVSGHKTRNVFDRYNITSERDLADAARKIELSHRQVTVDGEQNAKAEQEAEQHDTIQ